jgi:hypothetical protein
MKPLDMIVGKRYKIYHLSETQRVLHYSVMDYLGREQNESYVGQGPNYLFNARPEAGTQSMPPSWIQRVNEVPKNSPVVLNKIAR